MTKLFGPQVEGRLGYSQTNHIALPHENVTIISDST